MASAFQAQGAACASGIARRVCVQAAPVPGGRVGYGLENSCRSAADCRLLALESTLIRRHLRLHLRGNGQVIGTSTAVRLRHLAVCAGQEHYVCEDQDSRAQPQDGHGLQNEDSQVVAPSRNAAWRTLTTKTMGAVLAGTLLFGVSSAGAVDALKTCACLLRECRSELALCIANPGCAANVACLQTCNNRPDETECQIGCGDLFENSVVDRFNDCAVTRKGCVPQKQDDGKFPIPAPGLLVETFDPRNMTGKWYITSGFNKTFDIFDCQLHEFTGKENGMTAKLTWRIQTPDGGFFTRSAVQNFVQDTRQPGLLLNHGNEFLHYQDDWYILSAKLDHSFDDYMFVYYRGSNDAWDGYGGAVIYTRSSTLPIGIIPELARSAKTVGLDFKKFTITDNSCGPEAPLFARLGTFAGKEEAYFAEEIAEEENVIVSGLKQVVGTVGQFLADIVAGDIKFFTNEIEEARKEEEFLLRELGDEEKALLDDLNMGARDFVHIFGKPVPIRKVR